MLRFNASVCFLLGSLLLGLTTAAPRPGLAGTQPAPTSSDVLLSTFYKDPRPERLVGFLDEFKGLPQSQRWGAYPPLVGFFAVVFRNHPDWIGRLIPTKPNGNAVETLAAALHLSGEAAHAVRMRTTFADLDADRRLKVELSNLPNRIEDLRVVTPTHLDILWGAAFASGDERYVKMIADFFAKTANQSEPIAIDVAKTTIAITGGPKEILQELRSKHGEALAREIIFAATALWALRSNAKQHDFVEQAESRFVRDHIGAPATKAIVALRGSAKPR
jgi:hypothetical protein